MGPTCSDLLLGLLQPLAELRDSYKFIYNTELEYAVGAAVRSMGPDVVLGVISLKVSVEIKTENIFKTAFMK